MNKNDAINLFSVQCANLIENGTIELFVPFKCPISIVDADVKEYVVDEYDTVELFILKLFNCGIDSPEMISDLTGIHINLINKIIRTEKMVYGHIDSNSNKLTKAGLETIQMDMQNDSITQHALYSTKRELQVDALTGTLIKHECEIRKYKMEYFDESSNFVFIPLSSVQIDNELRREIEERLQFYLSNDYFNDDNSIDRVEDFTAKELKYRDAFFVKISNLPHPFIVIIWCYDDEQCIAPIAISSSDAVKVKNSNKYLVRRDSCFEYLTSLLPSFTSLNKELESGGNINE